MMTILLLSIRSTTHWPKYRNTQDLFFFLWSLLNQSHCQIRRNPDLSVIVSTQQCVTSSWCQIRFIPIPMYQNVLRWRKVALSKNRSMASMLDIGPKQIATLAETQWGMGVIIGNQYVWTKTTGREQFRMYCVQPGHIFRRLHSRQCKWHQQKSMGHTRPWILQHQIWGVNRPPGYIADYGGEKHQTTSHWTDFNWVIYEYALVYNVWNCLHVLKNDLVCFFILFATVWFVEVSWKETKNITLTWPNSTRPWCYPRSFEPLPRPCSTLERNWNGELTHFGIKIRHGFLLWLCCFLQVSNLLYYILLYASIPPWSWASKR